MFSSISSTILRQYADEQTCSPSELSNFAKTPERVAKAWPSVYKNTQEGLDALPKIIPKSEVIPKLSDILSTGFPMEADEDTGLVTQGPIQAEGICPHHLLPVHYTAYVSYLPRRGGTVVGLSKLARVVKLLTARPVLQEQAAVDIVDALHRSTTRAGWPSLDTEGAAVQLIGEHTCMSCRGVHSSAKTLSTVLRGAYRQDGLRSEFYQAVEALYRHKA